MKSCELSTGWRVVNLREITHLLVSLQIEVQDEGVNLKGNVYPDSPLDVSFYKRREKTPFKAVVLDHSGFETLYGFADEMKDPIHQGKGVYWVIIVTKK